MATRKRVSSPHVPEPPPGTFSRAIQVGDQLFVAGITAGSPSGPEGVSMYDQTRSVFTKIRHLVEAAGGTMNDIMKMTIYVTDMGGRADIGKARGEVFTLGKMPCSTLVEIKSLAQPGLKIEIDATAVLGAGA